MDPRRTPSSPGTPRPSDGPAAFGSPGSLLAGRYRILGLLGRGGMGEVYRADDLTLGQSVALKFLPPAFARDADRLRRFYQEVRVAREVSHPNVCRVYDVGEAEGRAFLSMEFVDGEDLASLLRRIGRLPQEKGVEIARQLCAGLAALHERGVVHRDLKPANVMLDGRGRVRLTDFGLAAVAEEVGGREVRAGTPAYMAPEQLRGERVDVRSDLFALGLVLYEIFTGKRAFVADTPAELQRLHRDSSPKSPSTHLPDLDPVIERVISRCLEMDPAERPSSALMVAAALPGGDPLAAALAAGEIPSLEMVAAAGTTGGIRPWVGALCLVAVCAALFVTGHVNLGRRLHGLDPMEKSPAVLTEKARELLRTVGHDAPVEDTQWGLALHRDVIGYLEDADSTAARWETLRDARPPGVFFWYRESPFQLIPWQNDILPEDPPLKQEGMANVWLDTKGRLILLAVVPPDWVDPAADSVPPPVPDWTPLFAAAGLDPADFRPATPAWTPMHFADTRAAWEGRFPGDTTFAITVEAASFRGRPTSFVVAGPWTPRKERLPADRSRGDRIIESTFVIGIFAILVGALLWAVRNVRLGRGDRVGARRLSLSVLGLILLVWALTVNHSPRPQDEVNFFLESLGAMLVASGMLWAFYLALEPYVRRTWPSRIVGWSRLLTGRVRDPLVGHDILVGGVFLLAHGLLSTARAGILLARGVPPPPPTFAAAEAFAGGGSAVAMVLTAIVNAVYVPMFLLILLLALRGIVRNLWVAAAVVVAIYGFIDATGTSTADKLLTGVVGAGSGIAVLVVLLRFGLLASIVGRFFVLLVQLFPVTFDSSAWYAGSSSLAMLVILATSAYGLWIALAGKSIFRE